MSKTLLRYRNLSSRKLGRGWGGEGRAPAPLLLQEQRVFIVMQISSCNLGHTQVHPVPVAGTETSASSLFARSSQRSPLSLSRCQGLFCHKAPASLERWEHLGGLGEPGGHCTPLPLAGGMCQAHTGACCDAVRFWREQFRSIRVAHRSLAGLTPPGQQTQRSSPTGPETLPCTPVRTALKNTAFASGKRDVQIETGNLQPSCTKLDFSSPPAWSEPVNV